MNSCELTRFLAELDANGIPYVSWKNNHELKKTLSGDGDIDLFIPLGYRSELKCLCQSEGWKESINPIATYPWISHYYTIGKESAVYHIHVYHKIVTGESWLKEFVLPLDSWMLENRIKLPGNDIWVLNNYAQAYVFIVRHLLKGGSLLSRLLYRIEKKSYYNEWLFCIGKNFCTHGDEPINIDLYLDGALLSKDQLLLPRLSSSIRFRISLFSYLRLKWYLLFTYRIASFVKRALNKIIFKKKKILPGGGLVIAVSGVDGSGKSTMLNEASLVLGKWLTLKRYHLGRPQGELIDWVRRRIMNYGVRSVKRGTDASHNKTSLRKAVAACVIALLRLKLAKKIISQASKGCLVLVDRWPTACHGKMDGPRIKIDNHAGLLLRAFGRLETWAYKSMPLVDIIFWFDVPVECAISRNRMRIKVDKETDEQIESRFEMNRDFVPIAHKTIRFDNNGDFPIKKEEFIQKLWAEIVAH